MKAVAFDLAPAADLADAVAVLAAREGAKVMAGGCSLGPMLNLRLARPSALVDLRRISSLRRLVREDTHLGLGAGWTHAEIEDGVVPDVTLGLMRRVAHGIAYRAVRNRGTIGGSLAHADPAADWVSTLTALDAELVIVGPGGTRTARLPAFMTAAYTPALAEDEILTAVRIPILAETARWGYHKICRKTGEFAQAIGAVVVDRPRGFARIVCGAVEAPPVVLVQASAALLAGETARVQALAREETLAALAGHDATFRDLHVIAVERSLNEAGL